MQRAIASIIWLFDPIGGSTAAQFAIIYRAGRSRPDPAGSERPCAGAEMVVFNRDICNCCEAWARLPGGVGCGPDRGRVSAPGATGRRGVDRRGKAARPR